MDDIQLQSCIIPLFIFANNTLFHAEVKWTGITRNLPQGITYVRDNKVQLLYPSPYNTTNVLEGSPGLLLLVIQDEENMLTFR